MAIHTPQSNNRLHLTENQYKTLDRTFPGQTIECEDGVLWVTQKGDREDHILLRGDKLVIEHRGKVLIEAMRESNLTINN